MAHCFREAHLVKLFVAEAVPAKIKLPWVREVQKIRVRLLDFASSRQGRVHVREVYALEAGKVWVGLILHCGERLGRGPLYMSTKMLARGSG